MTNTMSEDRLRNVRAWAASRPDMSGSEVIVGAIDELLHLREEVVRLSSAAALRPETAPPLEPPK